MGQRSKVEPAPEVVNRFRLRVRDVGILTKKPRTRDLIFKLTAQSRAKLPTVKREALRMGLRASIILPFVCAGVMSATLAHRDFAPERQFASRLLRSFAGGMILGATVRPYHIGLVVEDIRSRVRTSADLLAREPSASVTGDVDAMLLPLN
jgi:hypothetical protein